MKASAPDYPSMNEPQFADWRNRVGLTRSTALEPHILVRRLDAALEQIKDLRRLVRAQQKRLDALERNR